MSDGAPMTAEQRERRWREAATEWAVGNPIGAHFAGLRAGYAEGVADGASSERARILNVASEIFDDHPDRDGVLAALEFIDRRQLTEAEKAHGKKLIAAAIRARKDA